MYLWLMLGKSCKNNFIFKKKESNLNISEFQQLAKFTSNFHVLSWELDFLKFQ
jgi:hypothetical protein